MTTKKIIKMLAPRKNLIGMKENPNVLQRTKLEMNIYISRHNLSNNSLLFSCLLNFFSKINLRLEKNE
jgi:hypothetical protein